MTVELVTGHAGVGHIDGFDVGGLIGGIAGDGDYVLQEPYGTISCTVKDNNHVIIGKGDLIMSGRHVRIEDPETLTVTSGTQGQQRHDLVVMHYERQSSGVETAELRVLRGTPGASGTPDYNTGSILNEASERDMPLYRLDLDGISLSTSPARLFSTLTPVSSIMSEVNSLAQPVDVSGQFTPANGWRTESLQCIKIGACVTLTCFIKQTGTLKCSAWSGQTMLKCPSWLGAVKDTTIPAASNGSADQGGNLYVTANQTHIDVVPAMGMTFTAGRWISFSLSWIAES